MKPSVLAPRRYRAYGARHLENLPALERLGPDRRDMIRAVAAVLPFRVNDYVLEELVDWDAAPDDPMFRLVFPQPEMLDPRELGAMLDLVRSGADRDELRRAARPIQLALNPHPAGQLTHNVPTVGGEPLPGLQHKYRETVLFFPSQGQTCHAYCTYCFRWAQFVGIDELKLADREPARLARYVREHPDVTSVLFTGGDPMVMRTKVLRRYVEPLLAIDHVHSIRFGTKALAWWPYRFVTDPDADDLMRLFEEVARAGKHPAVMGHYSHPRELSTPIAEEAVRRVRSAGATVRTQAPLMRGVNDDPEAWASMWRSQIRLGAVPYYTFVARDTGPRHYFEVPLARALSVFEQAYRRISGLGRTVRGPSMSATPGKVLIDGVSEVAGERVFTLKLLQARDPSWVNRPFFAAFDPNATWLDQLRPAFGAREHFYEPELRRMLGHRAPEERVVLTTLEPADAE